MVVDLFTDVMALLAHFYLAANKIERWTTGEHSLHTSIFLNDDKLPIMDVSESGHVSEGRVTVTGQSYLVYLVSFLL